MIDLTDYFFRYEAQRPTPWQNLSLTILPTIKAWEENFKMILTEEQKEAVISLLNHKVAFLCGGPGTGKSTISRIYVDILKSRGISVTLLSPTGKAAQRLSEVCGEDATTIHRALLMGSDLRSKRGIIKPFKNGAIIIDEASMMSRPLLNHFLQAVPNRATLLFIGDPDQLLPVGEKGFLREALEHKWAHVSKLTKIMRQAEGSNIIRLSKHVQKGNFPAIPDTCTDLKMIQAEDAKTCIKHLLKSYKISDTIIVPTNVGPLGAIRLNRLIQKIFNRQKGEEFIGEVYRYKLYDNVMQIENNYRIHKLGVFNGEQGKVVKVDKNGATIRFGRKVVKYDKDSMKQLSLCYAITAHKSQGSEMKKVFFLLTSNFSLSLNRSLLYTAITRAKEELILIGDLLAFKQAAKNEEQTK